MKNNNKGFTIIEIISVLAILAVVGTVIVISLNRTFKKSNEDEYNNIVNKVTSAADIYVENDSNIKNELATSKGYVLIEVKDLIATGFLDREILNNSSIKDKKITENTKVKVSLDANGIYIFELNPDIKDESYLVAQNLILSDESAFVCTNLDGVNFIKPDGSKIAVDLKNIIKINCDNVKLNTPGTYEIIYTYKTLETGIEKTFKRKITIYSELLETTKLEINFTANNADKNYLTYGEVITYKLIIKNTSSYSRTINVKDLLIKEAIDHKNNKYLEYVTTDSAYANAQKFFSFSGLDVNVNAGNTATYEFKLKVIGNAGDKISYQTTYTISNHDSSNQIISSTTSIEKSIEKELSFSAISTKGVNVVLVLDNSGSMGNYNRIDKLKKAAKLFIEKQDYTSSKICVVKFGASASLIGCGQNTTTLINYLNSLTASESNTKYGIAFTKAQEVLNGSNFTGFSGNKKFVVFLSDGIPGDSGNYANNTGYYKTASDLKNNGVSIYTIAVDGANTILKNLASTPQEKYYYESSSSNLSAVFADISMSINTTGDQTTENGRIKLPTLNTNKKIKFTIINGGATTILEFNNVADAKASGYITSDNKIDITKFSAGAQILFSYYVI